MGAFGLGHDKLEAALTLGTLIVVYVTKALTGGLRVERDEEIQGLDLTSHGERGWMLD